ncbi:oxygen-insensitive NADPH nitroreductase [Texcoconibacillus texcoconensis]|nr:oxygen-insensitive NADPH nitroreductase [Texcoconibacillus texcoconensis]
MNETIETLLGHRSIRSFTDQPLTDKQIEVIVRSAQTASTSSFIQAYSIIGITNPSTKETLAELAGNQPYVKDNGHFFVFCADLYRHEQAGAYENTDVYESIESTEKFLVSAIDASLAAQNAAVAAESLGLGLCYIGGLRNNIEKVSKILDLPAYVVPLFGMCIGYPAKQPEPKPRLPFENIYHKETYNKDTKELTRSFEAYNDVISKYYYRRTKGKRDDRWTEQIANMLKEPKRLHMKPFLENKGFIKY